VKRGLHRDDDNGEDSASPAPPAKRRRGVKDEVDEDDTPAPAPAPKRFGPGRRKKYVEKDKEEVIDWDALRAPTPPGSCPTPPWRRQKPPAVPFRPNVEDEEARLPTGVNHMLVRASNARLEATNGSSHPNKTNNVDPTLNSNPYAKAANDSKAAGSYPTPPLQPYDLARAQPQRHNYGQSQGHGARWGSKMVNWGQSMPESEERYDPSWAAHRNRVSSPTSLAMAGQPVQVHVQASQDWHTSPRRSHSSDIQSLTQSPQQSRMKINHLLND